MVGWGNPSEIKGEPKKLQWRRRGLREFQFFARIVKIRGFKGVLKSLEVF